MSAMPAMQPQAYSRNPTAIVVDDDAFVLATIIARLKKMGVDAVPFQAVGPTIEYIKSHKADFAIIDLGLPDGDGSEIITAARNSKANADMPIIIVTANKNDRTFMQSLENGRAMFVSQKPIDWSCLEYVLQGTVLEK